MAEMKIIIIILLFFLMQNFIEIHIWTINALLTVRSEMLASIFRK